MAELNLQHKAKQSKCLNYVHLRTCIYMYIIHYWLFSSPGLGLSVQHNVLLCQRFLGHSSQYKHVLSAIITIHQAQFSLHGVGVHMQQYSGGSTKVSREQAPCHAKRLSFCVYHVCISCLYISACFFFKDHLLAFYKCCTHVLALILTYSC